MRSTHRASRLKLAFVLCATSLFGLGVGAGTAHAIIGRPLSPMSFAGVARRTTRRAVYGGAAYGAYGAYATPYVPPPVYAAPPPVYAAPPAAYW